MRSDFFCTHKISTKATVTYHDNKDSKEEKHLEAGVKVDTLLLHVLGEGHFWVLAGLHEEKQETVPELNSRQRGETHEQKDSQEHWEWNELQKIQEEHSHSKQEVTDEHSQAGFLDTDEFSLGILFSQGVQVNDARNSGSNQPRKPQKSIDAVEESIQDKIVVVGFSMFKLVVLVVNQVPSDSIIKVAQKESHDGRAGSSNWSPAWDTTKVDKPVADSSWLFNVRAISRPEALTGICTALEGGFKSFGDLQLLSLHIREHSLLDDDPDHNGHGHSKIVDRATDKITTEEGAELEGAEEEDQGSGSKTHDDTQ